MNERVAVSFALLFSGLIVFGTGTALFNLTGYKFTRLILIKILVITAAIFFTFILRVLFRGSNNDNLFVQIIANPFFQAFGLTLLITAIVLYRRPSHENSKTNQLGDVARSTLHITSMVFVILIGATMFSLVFRGFGGDELVGRMLSAAPGGAFGALILVMVVMFVLGFFLDFIEITFVIVPLVAPPLLAMGMDPIWLGILMALNLQTSFLTPPFGFALFYLRGVAPPEVTTTALYKGIIPFIGIQIFVILLVAFFPQIATSLPELMAR